VPLIHDDGFSNRAVMPNRSGWFTAAAERDVDASRGLRFNSADHAPDATVERAGVFLAHDALAYDDFRTGRLVAPFDLTLLSGCSYCFVCAKKERESPNVQAFSRVAQGGGGGRRLDQAPAARNQFAAGSKIVRFAQKAVIRRELSKRIKLTLADLKIDATSGREAQIAVIARRKGEPWCNLDYRSQRPQTWACKKVQVRLSRRDGHSQFARTAMALRAGRPRRGIT
jgi:hypothetical protein